MVVEGRRGVTGWLLTPQLLDQTFASDDLIRTKDQDCENNALSRPGDLDDPIAVQDLHGAEHTELHSMPTVAPS